MPDRADEGSDRRRHTRHPGPFNGARLDPLETPLQIFELSVGGCFINSTHEQKIGVMFKMRIDIPGLTTIPVTARVIYRRPGGYAVAFVDLDEGTANRIAEVMKKSPRQ
jgi:PilZ domain-containing protein